ncbi:MAG: beta-ketoacyl-[acyl-carrier-protein] synthase family protein [Planctomycetota bacterium]|nr:MAG: beta-ketoacyl-[acyl-carrier-protein] synthase family protein [Planctomycetota bacterium]
MIARPVQTDAARRVVITGTGAVTPLGGDVDSTWAGLLAGRTGFAPITRFDARTFSTCFAAEADIPDLAGVFADPSPHAGAGRNTRFALAAAAQAWRQAGLGDARASADPPSTLDRSRVGIYLGSGEGILDFDTYVRTNLDGWDADARAVDTVRWARAARERMDAVREIEQESNMTLAHVAQAFGAEGPASNCLTACTASTQAIGEAAGLLSRGDADVMIAGGAHTMIHPLGVTGFIRLTALSSRRDAIESASRPFSLDRDGFVMGEGAGMLVLETLAHARARGAEPIAEIVGFGSSADAFRVTDIQPEGLGAQHAMRDALGQAGLDPRAVGDDGRPAVHYISAHGTGTRENDAIETRAVRAVFGDRADAIPMSSVKSMLGHLIAAAGAVEAIVCAKVIQTGVAPPTQNLRTPDPACDLDYVPNEPRDLNPAGGVRVALSNSFGFGGQNNTLILARFEG